MRWAVATMMLLLPAMMVLPARADDAPKDIEALIADLASPDPAERNAAAEKIKDMGLAARPALIEAMKSDIPAVRTRAATLLQELPWYLPSDPPEVREALKDYNSRPEPQRFPVIGQLHRLGAGDALLRMLPQETSDVMQWHIVNVLRMHLTAPRIDAVKQLDAGSSPPVLALQAIVWRKDDSKQAGELLARAIELQKTRPSPEAAYQVLLGLARTLDRVEDAASLLRMQARRHGSDQPSPPLLDLFALHARYGPLKGFGEDVATYRVEFDDARLLYALGEMMQRAHCPVAANGLFTMAYALGEAEISLRYQTGAYLLEHGWLDRAEVEWRALLNEEGAGIEANFRLSRIAAMREDDLAAAQYLQAGLEKLIARQGPDGLQAEDATGHRFSLAVEALWAEIHWRYLRAAREKNDEAEVENRLAKLVELNSDESHITLDVVPELKKRDRMKEANRLFERSYKKIHTKVQAEPSNPEHLNNLAWLCARSGERLEEALDLATRAVAAEPDSAAYLDTLAEAHFRLGHREEAIKLEERAIELRPNDKFMREQLERFKTEGLQ